MYKKVFLSLITLCLLVCASACAEKVAPTPRATLSYTGEEQQLLADLGTPEEGYTWQYFFYGTTGDPMYTFPSKDIPVGTAVDKYQVHCFHISNEVGEFDSIGMDPDVSYEVTILPAITTVPVAKTGLVANRSDQSLLAVEGVCAGKRSDGGGGMEYSVTSADAAGPGSWSGGSPMASLAGDYKIWYRASVEGPDRGSYASHWFITEPQYITVSIAPEPVYTVTTKVTGEGSVMASNDRALRADPISLTITPEPGHRLKSLAAADANGDEILISDNSFNMPASNVTVTVEFERIPVELESFDVSAIKGDKFSLVPHFVTEAFAEISYGSDVPDSDTVQVDPRTGVISILNDDAETVVITMYAEDTPAIAATIKANEGLAVTGIADQTELIKEEAFAGTAIEAIDMSGRQSVAVGKNAFLDCDNLVRVVLPETVRFENSGSTFVLSDGAPLSGVTVFCADEVQAELMRQINLNCVLIEK